MLYFSKPCVFVETSSNLKTAITEKTDFSKMIVLSSWRYETILRVVCFGGVDMMDPPSKVRFCSSYSKIHKIIFLSLNKNLQISSKIGQNGSPEAKNLFPGVF